LAAKTQCYQLCQQCESWADELEGVDVDDFEKDGGEENEDGGEENEDGGEENEDDEAKEERKNEWREEVRGNVQSALEL